MARWPGLRFRIRDWSSSAALPCSSCQHSHQLTVAQIAVIAADTDADMDGEEDGSANVEKELDAVADLFPFLFEMPSGK